MCGLEKKEENIFHPHTFNVMVDSEFLKKRLSIFNQIVLNNEIII